ncbi:unnamed protein product [marine sediment metagenome]|uniref:Uncharacterized protein n=1 Tax=marine sediment metagenome TaxID=412755 RepID=X1SY08_9ZZZZ
MPSEEFERLKEALRRAESPEARKAAAEAMKRYLETKKGSSKPTLVSLGLRKTYPHAIPLEQIPDELERNPEFFELIKRAVTKER